MPKTRPMKQDGNQQVAKDEYRKQEEAFEETKINGKVASGYLIGRHPECGKSSKDQLPITRLLMEKIA